jgi:hypothetical protein
MGKARHFQLVDLNQSNFIMEWQAAFNQQGYLDDLISIPIQAIGFIYDGTSWFRTLASPFFLEDVITFGKIGLRKSHQVTHSYRVFLVLKDTIYQDQWALDYVQKKRLGKFPFEVYGGYSFKLIQPEKFLQQVTDLGLELGTIDYITLTKKINDLFFQELAMLSTQPEIQVLFNEQERFQQRFQESIHNRFLKFGLELVSFHIKFHLAKP